MAEDVRAVDGDALRDVDRDRVAVLQRRVAVRRAGEQELRRPSRDDRRSRDRAG
jgi:hypothetical protein